MKIVLRAIITSIQLISPNALGNVLKVPITPEALFLAKLCASS